MNRACESHPMRSGLERWHRGVRGQSPCLQLANLCLDCWHDLAAVGVEGIQLADGTPWKPTDPPVLRASPVPPKESTMPTKAEPTTVVIPPVPPVAGGRRRRRNATIECLAQGGETPTTTAPTCQLCWKSPIKIKAKGKCSSCYDFVRRSENARKRELVDQVAAASSTADEHTGIDLVQVRQNVNEAQAALARRLAAVAALEKLMGRWPDTVPMQGRVEVELVLARIAQGQTP